MLCSKQKQQILNKQLQNYKIITINYFRKLNQRIINKLKVSNQHLITQKIMSTIDKEIQNNLEIDEQRKKRRKRADEDGRNFSCSCGKSYLSYPALYTHIKTKHPESEKLKNDKEQQLGNSKHQQSPKQQNKEQSQNSPLVQQPIYNFPKFKQFLQKHFSKNKTPTNIQQIRNSFNLDEKQRQYIAMIKQLQVQGQRLVQIPMQMQMVNKKSESHQQQRLNQQKQSIAMPMTALNINISIDQALGRFLNEMGNCCNYTCNLALSYFVCALHECFINTYHKAYTEETSVSGLPQFLNQFVIKFLSDKNQYINQPIVICKLIYYFCRWLYKQKFTQQLIRFNQVRHSSSNNKKSIQ